MTKEYILTVDSLEDINEEALSEAFAEEIQTLGWKSFHATVTRVDFNEDDTTDVHLSINPFYTCTAIYMGDLTNDGIND